MSHKGSPGEMKRKTKNKQKTAYEMTDCDWSSDVCSSDLTLCDPIDGSPPGSPVPGILQARTLEWVAISFS